MPTLAEILAKKSPQPAQPSATAGATLIRATDEKEQLAAKIKTTLDATSPKAPRPIPGENIRELGATENGERIPMDTPHPGAADQDFHWFDCLHSFTTDLCIVMDPRDTGAAWLAVVAQRYEPPILLHKFPLCNRPPEESSPF
jgi:hypothetical protein